MIEFGVEKYIVERYDMPNYEKNLLYKNTILEKFINEANNPIMNYLLKLVSTCRDETSKILMSDILFNLPGDYCVKVDCANMAHSIESRSPFLEHSLIDYVSKIPTKILLKSKQQKYILKQISEKRFPKENIYRTKQGFSIPLKQELMSNQGKEILKKIYTGNLVRDNYINLEGLKECYLRVEKGLTNPKLIWNIIILEQWYNDIHLGDNLNLKK